MSRLNVQNCKIRIGEQQIEKVSELKYLRSMLCKNDTMESEIRERAIQKGRAIGELGSVIRVRFLSVNIW